MKVMLNQKRVCMLRLASQERVTRPLKEYNLFSKHYYVNKALIFYESAMGIKKDFRCALLFYI